MTYQLDPNLSWAGIAQMTCQDSYPDELPASSLTMLAF